MNAPENIHTSSTMQTEKAKFIYVEPPPPHTHTLTISENRGHEFERKQGQVYERVWREKMGRVNDVIITQPKNQEEIFKQF